MAKLLGAAIVSLLGAFFLPIAVRAIVRCGLDVESRLLLGAFRHGMDHPSTRRDRSELRN